MGVMLHGSVRMTLGGFLSQLHKPKGWYVWLLWNGAKYTACYSARTAMSRM